MVRMQVTFWRACFTDDAYAKLIERLKKIATKGEGFWFMERPNYVRAYLTEADYERIMDDIPDLIFS